MGFVLPAAGSAIGLGAIWKFPYGRHWRRRRVLPNFHRFHIINGLPLLLAEFVIGRSTQKAVDAYREIAPKTLWPWLGKLEL